MNALRLPAILLAAVCIFSSCGNGRSSGDSNAQGQLDTLSAASFTHFIHSEGIKIVEFGGKHCGPCERMRKRLVELQQEIPTLRLGLVFWEDSPELFQDCGVTYIPVQVVYNSNGNETTRHLGEWEVDSLKRAVSSVRNEGQ